MYKPVEFFFTKPEKGRTTPYQVLFISSCLVIGCMGWDVSDLCDKRNGESHPSRASNNKTCGRK